MMKYLIIKMKQFLNSLARELKEGAYKSKTRIINADVNGAYNTMVKEDTNYIIGNREQLGFNPILIKL